MGKIQVKVLDGPNAKKIYEVDSETAKNMVKKNLVEVVEKTGKSEVKESPELKQEKKELTTKEEKSTKDNK